MKLSIIIPVYNVERYVRNTLNSIFNQQVYSSLFEVIVVNDGTLDNSMKIVDEFVQKYENLQVINQENKGLSCARNAGLDIAKGEYIWFVDSDDQLIDGALNDFLELISQIDVEVFCFDINEMNEKDGSSQRKSIFTHPRFYKYYDKIGNGYFYCRKLPFGIVQRYIFKREFLRINNMYFMPHVYHEDIDFLTRILTISDRILPIHKTWYSYLIREQGSITSTFNIKRIYDRFKIVNNFQSLAGCSNNHKNKEILNDSIFEISFGLLYSPYKNNTEYSDFLILKIQDLKKFVFVSFFRSLHFITLGKLWKFVRVLLKIKR